MIESQPQNKLPTQKDIPIADLLPLRRGKVSADNLPFGPSTLSVTRQEDMFFARINRPIYQQELYHMLESLAPVKRQALIATYDDWRILRSGRSKTDSLIVHAHANSPKIEKEWAEFRKNFDSLFYALKRPSPILIESLFANRPGVSFEEARESFFEEGDFREAFNDLGLDDEPADRDFYSNTLNEIYEITKERRDMQGNINRTAAYTYFWKEQYNPDLMKVFFNNHPEYVSPNHIAHAYWGRTAFYAEVDGDSYVVDGSHKSIDNIQLNNKRIKIGFEDEENDTSEYVATLTKDEDGAFSLKVDLEAEKGNAIYPVIAWRKTRNRFKTTRTLISDPSELSVFDMRANDNLLLGIMSIVYMEPWLRNDWPEKQSHTKGGYMQEMRAAQVPVLALQDKEKLARGLLLKNIEKEIRS